MNRNIFNRRMFAEGDEVNAPVLNEQIILELQEIGIDPTNKSYEEINEEIDSFIATEGKKALFDPTDPVDLISAGLTATGIGAAIGGPLKAIRTGVKGKQAYEKISRLQQIKNMLNPIQKTPGKVQMSKTGEAIIGSPSIGVKLPQSALYAGQGVGMLDDKNLSKQAEIIKSDLSNLEQSEVKKEEEFKVEESKNNTKTKSSEKEMEEAYKNLMSVYGTAKENASKDYEKRKNTFDRTNLFLEEISTALAESGGDIGYGLSTGAAKAAKRISEEEMLEKEKFSSFLKDQQEANKLSPSERTKLAESYSESITHLDNMGFILGQVEDLENMVNTGKVTGFSGLSGRVLGKIKGFTGFSDDVIMDETKSLQILEFIRSQLIRELLNESGRTISNLDRQLIDQITGDIADIGSGKGAINESISRVKDRIRTAITKSRNNVAFIDNEFGAQMPNLQIFRKGFGQRSEKPSYEKDDVVVTEEDVINPGRSRNK